MKDRFRRWSNEGEGYEMIPLEHELLADEYVRGVGDKRIGVARFFEYGNGIKSYPAIKK